jgi:hypothetical protein
LILSSEFYHRIKLRRRGQWRNRAIFWAGFLCFRLSRGVMEMGKNIYMQYYFEEEIDQSEADVKSDSDDGEKFG